MYLLKGKLVLSLVNRPTLKLMNVLVCPLLTRGKVRKTTHLAFILTCRFYFTLKL